jgi:hypothetical protein
MVQLGGESDTARLKWSGLLLQWTPTGSRIRGRRMTKRG